MRKLFLVLTLICATALQAQDYYVVTGKNVNVRRSPVNGAVVDKLGKNNSFFGWENSNGWVRISSPYISGYISSKYVKKMKLLDFSRKMLGNYIGIAPEPTSYTLANLSEEDGYLIMTLTDYTKPNELGFRGHTNLTFAGKASKKSINLTHFLYPYNPNMPIEQQLNNDARLDSPQLFVITEDGKLRSFERALELQE